MCTFTFIACVAPALRSALSSDSCAFTVLHTSNFELSSSDTVANTTRSYHTHSVEHPRRRGTQHSTPPHRATTTRKATTTRTLCAAFPRPPIIQVRLRRDPRRLALLFAFQFRAGQRGAGSVRFSMVCQRLNIEKRKRAVALIQVIVLSG